MRARDAIFGFGRRGDDRTGDLQRLPLLSRCALRVSYTPVDDLDIHQRSGQPERGRGYP